MSMSRLDTDFFTKNLHYATSWYEEHCENFEAMMDKLMQAESLAKLAVNAAQMTLSFNAKTRWVDVDYNKNVIEDAYASLIGEMNKDKMVLFLLVDEYMSFFEAYKSEFNEKDNPTRNAKDVANSPELVRIRKVFSDHQDALTDEHPLWQLVVKLLGAKLDREKALRHFLPQLMLFVLRILDIYDSAMNGMTVEDVLDMMKRQQAEAKAPKRREPMDEEDAIRTALGEKMLGQFGKPSFWQHRYDGIAPDFKPHDWYVSWGTIKDRVWNATKLGGKEKDPQRGPLRVLNLGCGNSLLAEALVDDPAANIEKILSIDFVESVVIAQQGRVKDTARFKDKLEFRAMDVLHMEELEDASFDLVIDKGTMDSLLTTATAATDFGDACKQISRVLKPGGWLVMVSCAIGYQQIKPLQNLTLFKWKVAHVSEMPSDINQETKINMLLINKLTDSELQHALETGIKSTASSSAATSSTAESTK
jgi:ubiquinone/menaquinone biosynthesis C-methylase UbiE